MSNTKSDILTHIGALVMLIFISVLFGLALVSRNLLALLAGAGWLCSHVQAVLRRGS